MEELMNEKIKDKMKIEHEKMEKLRKEKIKAIMKIEHEKMEKYNDNKKQSKVIDFIKSLFKDAVYIILNKKTKMEGKKYKRILLVSDLDDFQQRWDKIRKSKNISSDLKKLTLKKFLTINNAVVVELLDSKNIEKSDN